MGTVGAHARRRSRDLPALGLVCCIGSGFEGVDLAATRERRIVVTHSPAANASAVADLAVGLMIASVRRMFAANAFLRRGDWTGNFARRVPLVRGLTGRRVGIYGLGAIGEKIARRAAALRDRGRLSQSQAARPTSGYRYFDTLHALADVGRRARRRGARRRGRTGTAVDGGVLAALGAEGHVVNIARGSVIDEAALIAALRDGVIAGAGLDVYEHEPVVPDELLALANVALTPHIAGGTTEAQSRDAGHGVREHRGVRRAAAESGARTPASRSGGRPDHAPEGRRPRRLRVHRSRAARCAHCRRVVFVHGAASDHSVWALQSRYFAHHGCNVLALDLPAHGRSAGAPLPSVEAIADWLPRVLDAAGVASAATLVGHSLGSLAVARVRRARRRPCDEGRAARPRGADACERRAARRRARPTITSRSS